MLSSGASCLYGWLKGWVTEAKPWVFHEELSSMPGGQVTIAKDLPAQRVDLRAALICAHGQQRPSPLLESSPWRAGYEPSGVSERQKRVARKSYAVRVNPAYEKYDTFLRNYRSSQVRFFIVGGQWCSQSSLLVLSSSGITSAGNPVRTFGSKTSGANEELGMSAAGSSSTERIAGFVPLVASLDIASGP